MYRAYAWWIKRVSPIANSSRNKLGITMGEMMELEGEESQVEDIVGDDEFDEELDDNVVKEDSTEEEKVIKKKRFVTPKKKQKSRSMVDLKKRSQLKKRSLSKVIGEEEGAEDEEEEFSKVIRDVSPKKAKKSKTVVRNVKKTADELVSSDDEKELDKEEEKGNMKKKKSSRKRIAEKKKAKGSNGCKPEDDDAVEGDFVTSSRKLVVKKVSRKRSRPLARVCGGLDDEGEDGADESPKKKKRKKDQNGKSVKELPKKPKQRELKVSPKKRSSGVQKLKDKASTSGNLRKPNGTPRKITRKTDASKKEVAKKATVSTKAAESKRRRVVRARQRSKEAKDIELEQVFENVSMISSEGDDDATEDETSEDDAGATAAISKSSRRTDLGFIGYAGGDETLESLLDHAVNLLGGYSTVHNADAVPNIFVVGSKRRRTASVLRAIAAGVWVVKMSWVLDSISAQKWLPLAKYEAYDMYFGVRKARLEREKNETRLLRGIRIMIQGSLKIPNSTVSAIVAKAGGRVVYQRPNYIIHGNVGDSNEPLTVNDAAQIVSLDWLCDSIERWELCDAANYVPQAH